LRALALTLLLLVLGTAVLGAVSSCNASPSLPPLLGTPGDTGLGDLSAEGFHAGMCPGTGTVTITYDGGSAEQTCWRGLAANGQGEPAATIASNASATTTGLGLGILFFTKSTGGALCGIGPGSKLALDGPCLVIAAAYGKEGQPPQWQAYAGTGAPTFTFDAGKPGDGGMLDEAGSPPNAQGMLTVGSFGTQFGGTLSVTFDPGSTLVLDQPGYPQASISGTISVPIE
jgi:hypothetical protein